MPDPSGHPFLRPGRMNSYTMYSVGCAVAWAVALTIVGTTGSRHRFDQVLVFFGGWVVGWTSATLARVVYPPPKKRGQSGPRSFFQGYREQ